MTNHYFDRSLVWMKPLAMRGNKKAVPESFVKLDDQPGPLSGLTEGVISESVERIKIARDAGRPVMLSFGAHTIKNGLGLVLRRLITDGWITHLATNGAGIIHDWEFAFQGQTSEDVRGGVERGEFGNWEETGRYINLALVVGAYEGRGYGESVGYLISNEGLEIPDSSVLIQQVMENLRSHPEKAAAAADLLDCIERFQLHPGWHQVPHPHRDYSIQCAAFESGVPFTGHPMIGHDIIYNHPVNNGAAIGRAALRDFLCFANNVSLLDGGVYLSVGSAVMSPMIFEKSMSMAQNIAIQQGKHIDKHYIAVVDLQESSWDWSQGEPPEDNPDYYNRFCKSFSRMGGELRYASADNRDFLLSLSQRLPGKAV